ncbi:cytochrome c [Planctomycetota bacterium]|nr:cytochrome c [Planctomycetota bacterium]
MAWLGWAMAVALSAGEPTDHGYSTAIRPLLDQHCIACHGPDKQRGNLRLDGPVPDLRTAKARDQWEKVHAMLVRGEMPPEERPKLTTDELDSLTTWIRGGLERGIAEERGGSGRSTMRRLTRAEYMRMLEDVLGLRYANVPISLVNKLPTDPHSEGFINDGDLLSFQSMHLKAAVDVCERALSAVLVSGDRPIGFTYHIDHRTLQPIKNPYKHPGWSGEVKPSGGSSTAAKVSVISTFPIDDTSPVRLPPIWRCDGYLGRDKINDGSYAISIPYVEPVGVLRLRIRAGAVIPPGEGAPVMRIAIHNNVINQIFDLEVASMVVANAATDLRDYEVEIPLDLVEFPYALAQRAKYLGIRIFNDYTPIQDRLTPPKQKAEKGKEPPWPWSEPELVIDHVEVATPGADVWPPRRHTDLVAPGEGIADDRARATAILSAVASKAWRRPATGPEIAPFVNAYQARRQVGEGRDAALFQPLTAILVSPFATYRVERKAEQPTPLSGFELADRLAAFLWGGAPDQGLIELAKAGTLGQPATLAKQVGRLLDHQRSTVFIAEFLSQWLELGRVERDPIDFSLGGRTFNSSKVAEIREQRLKHDLAAEPVRYVEHLLRHDRGVGELIAGAELVVNDRLAAFYGIADVVGSEFRPVSAPENRRGGLLTMAGILAAASRGNKEAVIYRGVYLLGRILGESPGTPPGNVMPLDEQAKTDRKRSQLPLRQQLAAHTQINTCQLCHRKIDPLGFVWANFNHLGGIITPKPPARPDQKPTPIDCSGSLPDRSSFADLSEFVASIGDTETKSRYRFGEVFIRQLTSYALGRRLTLSDDALIRDLVAQARRDGWRLRAVITAIVTSTAFTNG